MTVLWVGDTEPAFTATCMDDGDPVNCTGAGLPVIHFDLPNNGVLIVTGAWVDAAAGTVRYAWGATDVAQSGDWRARVHVTFAGGGKQTFGVGVFPVGAHPDHAGGGPSGAPSGGIDGGAP